MDALTWEERFWVCFRALVEMETCVAIVQAREQETVMRNMAQFDKLWFRERKKKGIKYSNPTEKK